MAAERAQATSVAERTLNRKADRFDAEGMASLCPTRAPADGYRRRVPADLRHRILALKAEYPAFRPHETAAICRRREDCRVGHKTVQWVLTEGPLPALPERHYPPYAQIPDGARRRLANPELGEFRVHAALRQMGIHLIPRTCGRIMALNRQLRLPRPTDPVRHAPRLMPFAATYRHEYWSVDVRYGEDHGLADPKPVYVISILENYSRALLATVISPRQDLTADLIVLRAALTEQGSPMGIVSDGGGIF